MKRGWLLVLAGFLGCGEAFTPTSSVVSTLPDAGSSVSEVDAAPRPLDGGADMQAENDASGSVETAADASPDAPETTQPPSPEAGSDAPGAVADAWPSDVVVEPWCPDSEMWPVFSNTCYTWGAEHGWTLQGCCLPDHTCGTAWGSPRTCRK